jgi:hypothetical protein
MGSSVIQFRGKGFWAPDSDLEVWLYLLAQEVDRTPDPPGWLLRAGEHWLVQASVGFMGCVDPDLDRFAATTAQVAVMLQLTDRTLRRLDEYRSVLSPEDLNAMHTGGEGSYFTRAIPRAAFRKVGERFRMLLLGMVATDAKTAPVI